jgi:RNA polymerase sigma-70 factor (ECF subfamily)
MISDPRDIQLIEACLKGKAEAEYALYQKYGTLTFGICRRYTRDQMEAEDLHQVGWIKTFQSLKTYRKEAAFGAWIRSVFVSVCLTAYQKKKKEWNWLVFSLETGEMQNATDPSPPHDFLELENLSRLISYLPEGARLVFNLFAIEGLNHGEIAEKLGISEETSRQQLARARQKLKQQLSPPNHEISHGMDQSNILKA